tara:strand:+ start:38 stop:466 length:429 start_codon:yes stop_codon:yes gene_type:complete
MKRDMHIGGHRPLHIRAVEKDTFLVEDVFNPEAAKTDGNPFPEELQEEAVETTPLEEEGPTDYESMTVEELKALLRARNLDVKGKKAELITRLTEADTPSDEAVEVEAVAPSVEAATSSEGVSDNNAEDSRPDEPLGEQPSG